MKTILSILFSAISVIAVGQSKTWTGNANQVWLNQFPNAVKIDGRAANTLIVNNTNSVTDTSAVAAFQHFSTNQSYFSGTGGLRIGPNVNDWADYWELIQRDTIVSYFDSSKGEPAVNSWWLAASEGTGAGKYVNWIKFSVDSTHGFPMAYTEWRVDNTSPTAKIAIYASNDSSLGLEINSSGTPYATLWPSQANGSLPYLFDTTLTQTSNYLLKVNNNTTNKFSVSFDGKISTADPGSGAGAWQLGTVITGATVTLVTTNYVEVKIGASVVKLAIVQ